MGEQLLRVTHQLVARLLELDLAAGDRALFGRGPLLMRGWIEKWETSTS